MLAYVYISPRKILLGLGVLSREIRCHLSCIFSPDFALWPRMQVGTCAIHQRLLVNSGQVAVLGMALFSKYVMTVLGRLFVDGMNLALHEWLSEDVCALRTRRPHRWCCRTRPERRSPHRQSPRRVHSPHLHRHSYAIIAPHGYVCSGRGLPCLLANFVLVGA